MPRTIPIRPMAPQTSEAPAPGFDAERRRALKWLAASLAGTVGACTQPPAESIVAYGGMPENEAGDGTRYIATAYVREGYAHGVLVATKDGRPVKIEGNPGHPSSLGATDVFAQASILSLWDPDRSTTVMRRLPGSPKAHASTPGMVAASWRDAEQAWAPVRAALAARQGRGLYIVTGPFSSPTLQAQLAALMAAMPQAHWVGYDDDPCAQTSLRAGALACGRPIEPLWHLGRAQAVLCLNADPFHGGAASVRHAMDWATRRAAPHGERPHLLVAETAPGLAGARADSRIALGLPEIEAMVWRLAARLAPDEVAAARRPAENGLAEAPSLAQRAFEEEALRQLHAAGSRALIIPGDGLSASTQALIHRLHHQLGCVGQTVEWIEPVLARAPHTLPTLMDAMQAGEVQALWLLGCNPAYGAPASLRFAQAMRQVPFSVHTGLYADETAAVCDWHLPDSHVYEQWSDARAFDGTVSIVQPAIAPLYDTRSAHEVLALVAGHGSRPGYDIVRDHWRGTGMSLGRAAAGSAWAAEPDAGFSGAWEQALRTGLVEGSASQPLALPNAKPIGELKPLKPPESPREATAPWLLQIVPDHAVRHGAFANNGWLQELPRPFTSLTWGHALLIGPQSAAALKLATGDVARLKVAHGLGSVDCPVWVLQGHAEGAVTLSSGHGRWRAGLVGNGLGVNAHALRPLERNTVYAAIEKTGRRQAFAVRQVESSQEGRQLARTMSDAHASPSRGTPPLEAPAPQPSLYPEDAPAAHAWGMTIDLDACIGCGACTVACQAENNIPTVGPEEVAKGRAMHWIRVDTYVEPDGDTLFQPVPCMHCENAPCEVVCPVGATLHDSEGLNAQVYNRCIGTRFCSNNCPYKVRRFNFLQYTDLDHEPLKAMRNPDVTVRERGVMEKCSYCVQRISQARRQSEKSGEPLKDGDVVTACQAVCPTRAITFGDLLDPASRLVGVRASPRHYAMLGELNTRPRTTYLARRAPPRKDTA